MGASLTHANEICAANSHGEQRQCLERIAAESRVKLEHARALLIKRIQTWDEEASYRQRTLTLLNQSYDRFKNYRNFQCEYEASTAAGGNGAGDMRLQCQIDLNAHYVTWLNTQLRSQAMPP